jgi:hypothetical protein
VSVKTGPTREYAELAVLLLKRLLGVDLEGELRRPELEAERKRRIAETKERIRDLQERVGESTRVVCEHLYLVFEAVEPAFVMPSFAQTLDEWQVALTEMEVDVPLASYRLDEDEERLVLVNEKVPEDVWNSTPMAVAEFMERFSVQPILVGNLANSGTVVDFLAKAADVGLRLPGQSISSTLFLARLYAGANPDESYMFNIQPDGSIEDTHSKMVDGGMEILGKLAEIMKILHQWIEQWRAVAAEPEGGIA